MTRESCSAEKGVHWYCIRSQPKKERMASEVLKAKEGLEVFSPQVRFQRKTVRGKVWFQEAMFPGYFFVRFDLSESRRLIAASPGVLNIPMFNGRYIWVPDEIIESIKEELSSEEVVDGGLPLEEGELTTVLEGPMRGLQVKVVRLMPAKERVAVLMDMMGTLVESEFPVKSLEHRKKHPLSR